MISELKIKGHSGCSLNILENSDGRLIVEKSCKPSYIPRLCKQQEKQQAAYEKAISGDYTGINVPKSQWKDNKILMDYIHSMSFIEQFERATADDIRKLTQTLISYIDKENSLSENVEIDKSVFVGKIESVFKTCFNNYLIDMKDVVKYFTLCKEKIDSYDKIVLPVGVCHGDLTFSNILFTESGIYIIDFLDSFIETPLQDIVKIRQDSKYGWSTMMTDQSYNDSHVKTVLDYIDRHIHSYFEKYEFYKYYDMLQYINILRILPYVKEEKVYRRVCEILGDMKL